MDSKPVADAWELGDPYERFIGRWSRLVAPRFLSWLGAAEGLRWLDVGCGTGALCAAILERCAPSALTGVEPSEGFLAVARRSLPASVALHVGHALELPLADDEVDVAVSGLVLNFVPDPAAGLAEIARVTRPGGTVAAYVWDYADRMELLRVFWDAAVELDPSAAGLDEAVRFPLCRPDALGGAFTASGLEGLETVAIDVRIRLESFEDYWQPFLGGQGPAPSYVMSLDETARQRLRERLRQRLPGDSDGSIPMTVRAWAARGIVPPA